MNLSANNKRKLLIVEDEIYLAESIKDLLLDSGNDIHITQRQDEAMDIIEKINPDLMILDLALPPSFKVSDGIDFFKKCIELKLDCKIIIMTGQGKINDAIECIKLGAEDFLMKPINPDVLQIVVERGLYKQYLERKVNHYEKKYELENRFSDIIGKSSAMKKVFRGIKYAASMEENVLILGETGTGKGMVAKEIHEESKRRTHAYICINCASFSRYLIESELFGHEKGAFSGAIDVKVGKFEYANKGTLFLDEVGEVSIDLQAKLLHAVEEKRIQRVGGNKEIEVDVRIIAATNKNIEKAIDDRLFRRDLYYRLNVLPLYIPPLRERKEDIFLLASYFAKRYASKFQKAEINITPEAMNRLEEHDWPGNVRELENVIITAILRAKNEILTVSDLPDSLFNLEEDIETKMGDESEGFMEGMKHEIAKEYKNALHKAKGNKSLAARYLGIHESTFRYRLKKYQKFF